MRFDVAFNGNCEMRVHVHPNCIAESSARVSIWDITEMIHHICDHLDKVRPHDMEILKEAIDRFNYLTKVED